MYLLGVIVQVFAGVMVRVFVGGDGTCVCWGGWYVCLLGG